MDCIHGLADCLFHGGCIRSVKKFFILLAGITPVNVRIITQHALKSCKAWLRSKSRYVQLHTKYIHVRSWYLLVHTQNSYTPGYARGIPGLRRRSDFAVLRHKYILGAYLVWHSDALVRTTSYHAIVSYHLVLLCCGTYYPVPLFTILTISTFQFGTQYIQICTAISA
jgi:hypothetical protein